MHLSAEEAALGCAGPIWGFSAGGTGGLGCGGSWSYHSANCRWARWVLAFSSYLGPYTSFSSIGNSFDVSITVFESVFCLQGDFEGVCKSDRLRLQPGSRESRSISSWRWGIVLPAPRGCSGCSAWPVLLLHEPPVLHVPQQKALESGLAWSAGELKQFQDGWGKGLAKRNQRLGWLDDGTECCLQTYHLNSEGCSQVYFPFWQTVPPQQKLRESANWGACKS